MARALILQPEIIIIDDALSTLDASVRIQLLNLIFRLYKEHLGISYIYIGQNLGIIKHIADQVLVMDEGELSSLAHQERSLPILKITLLAYL